MGTSNRTSSEILWPLHTKNYALARHRNTTNHTNEDLSSICVTILAQARRGVDRKIAEASLISELKPPLNGKDEMEGIDLLIS